MGLMTYKEFDRFCGSLPAASKVVQWGGAHVWKVGGKVFAIGGWSEHDRPFVTFKCSPASFQMLKDEPGLRPAPYLAARGGNWIQMHGEPGLGAADLKAYITVSHGLVVRTLTRRLRKELGLPA